MGGRRRPRYPPRPPGARDIPKTPDEEELLECILSDPLLMDLRRTPALKSNELDTTNDAARVWISELDAEAGEMREGAPHRGGPIFEKRRERGVTPHTNAT